MDPRTAKISKALLDMARIADTALHQTEKGRRALAEKLLDGDDFNVLERIDGLRSVEHLIAISDDVVNVHALLGQLLAAGFASGTPETAPAAARATAPLLVAEPEKIELSGPAVATKPPQLGTVAVDEVSIAKRLLVAEARHLFGETAARLQPKIEACNSIEEIYDMIVKFQEHLAKTGKVDQDLFLDRLSKGLAEAKRRAAAGAAP